MNNLKRHPVTDLRQNILGDDYPHMAGAYIVIQCGASRAGDDAGYIREEHAEQWDEMQRSAERVAELADELRTLANKVFGHGSGDPTEEDRLRIVALLDRVL